MYRLIKYQGTKNLGDAIQSIAISRFFQQSYGGVYKNDFRHAKTIKETLVVNGYVNDARGYNDNVCYAGIFLEPSANLAENYQALRRSQYTVGSGIPATYRRCITAGLDCELVGCPTLTFERYDGVRSGRYAIDYHQENTEHLSQKIGNIKWDRQWKMAIERLNLLKKAEVVYTSRLHVALPCLAFGTPVFVVKEQSCLYPERFSIFEEMGLPYGKVIEQFDAEMYGLRYISFLRRTLGISGEPREPVFPR